MSPLRVLHVTEYFLPHRGGIELHVLALARHLRRHGTEAVVCTPFPGPAEVDSVPVRRLATPLLPAFNTVFSTHAVEPFQELLSADRFDLVHCHVSVYNPAATAAAYLAQRMGVPVVVTFHSVLRGYTRALAALDGLTGWSRLPVTFTAVSEPVAEQVRPLVGARPVAVLPSGIDLDAWRPLAAEPTDGAFRVVSTMRLARRKRPRALIGMLALLRDRLPRGMPLRARIIGEGPERDALCRLVAEHRLGGEVRLCGGFTHEELRREYARADVFALPSIEESFGIAALEARTAGLPVVIFSGSGPAGFIGHGREGLVAPTDAEFVASLVRLARDRELLARIAEHNRATLPPCGWDEVVRLHTEAYARAAGAVA